MSIVTKACTMTVVIILSINNHFKMSRLVLCQLKGELAPRGLTFAVVLVVFWFYGCWYFSLLLS